MAILKVLTYPNPMLRRKSEPVEKFDGRLRTLVQDLLDTMYFAKGVGLAAPQIGVPLRVCAIDTGGREETKTGSGAMQKTAGDRPERTPRSGPIVLVNPILTAHSDPKTEEEGCLSFPGLYVPVRRYLRCRVKAQDAQGRPLEMEAEGLLARALQHETDHLDGRLFPWRLSFLRRLRALRAYRKLRRRPSGGSPSP